MKICSCCEQEKPLTAEHFGRRPTALDGFNGICRSCVRNRQNARYARLRKKISTHVKIRRALLTSEDAEKARKRSRDWYRSNQERAKKTGRDRFNRIRSEMLEAYGGKCVCCGETTPLFLTIDHIENDGGAHRRELGDPGGSRVMMWLYKNGWPKEGYRLLCFNCNCGRQRNGGVCTHESSHQAFVCTEVNTTVTPVSEGAPMPLSDILEQAA